MNANPPDSDAVAIATIAAQMLPKIELPKGWQKMPEAAIREALQMPLPHHLRISAINPTKLSEPSEAAPFELLAEAAIESARILLNAARGVRRQERADVQAEQEYTKICATGGSLYYDPKQRAEAAAILKLDSRNGIPYAPVDVMTIVIKKCNPRTRPTVLKVFIADFCEVKKGWLEHAHFMDPVSLYMSLKDYWLKHRSEYSARVMSLGAVKKTRKARAKKAGSK